MFGKLSGLQLYLKTLINLEFEIFLNLEKTVILKEKHAIFNNFNVFSGKITIRHKKSII